MGHFIFRLSVTALCTLILSACSFVRYEYHPPVTEAGRQCAVQCAAIREMCISNENFRAQNDRAACEQRNHWNYQRCIKRADDKDDAKACARSQPMCWASPNTFRCEENYRSCFVSCGGQINVIKEE